jgi:hypothetical protein
VLQIDRCRVEVLNMNLKFLTAYQGQRPINDHRVEILCNDLVANAKLPLGTLALIIYFEGGKAAFLDLLVEHGLSPGSKMLSELAANGIDLDVFVAGGQHQVKAVQKASSLSEKVRQFQLLAWGDLSIIDTAITPENKLVCVDLINGHNDVQGKHHKPTTMSKMEVLRQMLHDMGISGPDDLKNLTPMQRDVLKATAGRSEWKNMYHMCLACLTDDDEWALMKGVFTTTRDGTFAVCAVRPGRSKKSSKKRRSRGNVMAAARPKNNSPDVNAAVIESGLYANMPSKPERMAILRLMVRGMKTWADVKQDCILLKRLRQLKEVALELLTHPTVANKDDWQEVVKSLAGIDSVPHETTTTAYMYALARDITKVVIHKKKGKHGRTNAVTMVFPVLYVHTH